MPCVDGGIRIEHGQDQIGDRFGTVRGQVGSDGVTTTVERMARGAKVVEVGGTGTAVSGECGGGLIPGDHRAALGVGFGDGCGGDLPDQSAE